MVFCFFYFQTNIIYLVIINFHYYENHLNTFDMSTFG